MGKKAAPFRTLGHLLEALLVVALWNIVSRMPRRAADRLASCFGAFLFKIDCRDRKWAYENLDIVFKESPLSQYQKDRIVKALFVHIVQGAFEYLQLHDIAPERYPEFGSIENPEAILSALDKKKGVLAVTAHLGNWEILGAVGAKVGLPVAAVLKRQHNPFTDRWLTQQRRSKDGVQCFYHGKGISHRIGNHLKQNGILAILADQRDISSSLAVPFFGAPGLTSDGPAKLHLWYESPIVFVFNIKQPDGRHLIRFDGPHTFRKSDDLKTDCLRIMTFINKKYEAVIKEHPEQWLSLLTPRWKNGGKDIQSKI